MKPAPSTAAFEASILRRAEGSSGYRNECVRAKMLGYRSIDAQLMPTRIVFIKMRRALKKRTLPNCEWSQRLLPPIGLVEVVCYLQYATLYAQKDTQELKRRQENKTYTHCLIPPKVSEKM